MEPEKRTAFYEKLYFHELESREKLISRLQFTLAFLTGLVGAWVFMLARLDFNFNASMMGLAVFFVAYVIVSVLLFFSSWYFVAAVWGHAYECLPSAVEIENYRLELHATYKDVPQGQSIAEDYFREFLCRYNRECSTANSSVNELRYRHLYTSTGLAVYSLLPMVVAGFVFIIAGLGKVTQP